MSTPRLVVKNESRSERCQFTEELIQAIETSPYFGMKLNSLITVLDSIQTADHRAEANVLEGQPVDYTQSTTAINRLISHLNNQSVKSFSPSSKKAVPEVTRVKSHFYNEFLFKMDDVVIPFWVRSGAEWGNVLIVNTQADRKALSELWSIYFPEIPIDQFGLSPKRSLRKEKSSSNSAVNIQLSAEEKQSPRLFTPKEKKTASQSLHLDTTSQTLSDNISTLESTTPKCS